MTPRQSAIKKVFEEAGVHGKVPKTSLGTYTYGKEDVPGVPLYQVEVFLSARLINMAIKGVIIIFLINFIVILNTLNSIIK